MGISKRDINLYVSTLAPNIKDKDEAVDMIKNGYYHESMSLETFEIIGGHIRELLRLVDEESMEYRLRKEGLTIDGVNEFKHKYKKAVSKEIVHVYIKQNTKEDVIEPIKQDNTIEERIYEYLRFCRGLCGLGNRSDLRYRYKILPDDKNLLKEQVDVYLKGATSNKTSEKVRLAEINKRINASVSRIRKLRGA